MAGADTEPVMGINIVIARSILLDYIIHMKTLMYSTLHYASGTACRLQKEFAEEVEVHTAEMQRLTEPLSGQSVTAVLLASSPGSHPLY